MYKKTGLQANFFSLLIWTTGENGSHGFFKSKFNASAVKILVFLNKTSFNVSAGLRTNVAFELLPSAESEPNVELSAAFGFGLFIQSIGDERSVSSIVVVDRTIILSISFGALLLRV